jgi:2-hydroxychromene-2-carboxylate isomerase
MLVMVASTQVRFYFDFISPYSWLALMRAETFAETHGVGWRPCPVVYGVLLDACDLVGPAEVDIKRRYTFTDVARCAARDGLELAGPPAHPFRSLEALRTTCLFQDDPRVMKLAADLANAAWGCGRDLTDPAVLADVVSAAGLDATDLAQRIRADDVKHALRASTERALAEGVFGVPSFLLDGELFWGHDRMEQLGERIDGLPPPAPDGVERILARPRGADRRRAPRGRSS